MDNTSSTFHISCFCNKIVVWILLVTLLSSFMPSVSLAQQPTATISKLKGSVLVNGQETSKGAVLNAGDVIETQAGASVVLKLSDGSTIDLSESTKLDIAVLSQTATGARKSRLKLWWGRIAGKLSPDHQGEDASFEIETENALVGVKFSEPIFEIVYDLALAQTIVYALTVALLVRNLLTNEEVIVPVGSTAIITAVAIEIISGIVGATAAAGGMGIGTKALGLIALAGLIGGVAALSGGSSSSSDSTSSSPDSSSFSGAYTWTSPCGQYTKKLNLSQNGNNISGTLVVDEGSYCNATFGVSGTVTNGTATLNLTLQSGSCQITERTLQATLNNDGSITVEPWGTNFTRV